MRILALGDIHGAVDKVLRIFDKEPDYDVVVVFGDVAPYGSPRQGIEVLRSICRRVEVKPILMVPGNMDDPSIYNEIEREFSNAKLIHGRNVMLDNINFVGVGGSPPTPFKTVFELDEEEILRILERAVSGITLNNLVLVSHAPPFNTKCDVVTAGMHVGSKAIRAFIERVKPLLCICGHIHESRNIDKLENTVIVNPGPARHGFYASIDIEHGTVNAVLKRI
ncbi:MAG TPA: metallophosphoesterase [Ignisphaera sp.]|uniref:Metallophosphoesterase n=1 Tax=Ignisphaera aggregans TaxID=334771 RepID=A0A832Z3J2_9CREN|nr:metallophosphoesterase [Ignisphaera sp.]HIP57203.1 metallophosphoesterase [Ignisphaera aggregans]